MEKEFNSYPELERLYGENDFKNLKLRMKFYDSIVERSRRLIKLLDKKNGS
ncbi:hypothetical protein LCGC14_1433790 [marine sediment metagenome]|uniref:Uncharacterized protein n=1 Tax=marine sediment metagenome TaxID=412755 RepID=A0A0F9JN78_9ZZZZ